MAGKLLAKHTTRFLHARAWLGLRAKRLAREQDGQTLVLAALSMVVLMGFIGLALDGGQLRYQKRRMQMAADAAATAAALEVNTCGKTANCAAMQTAAQNALTENGFSGSSLITGCGQRTGTRLELTVNNPPCQISSDPNLGNNTYVEVIASEPVPTLFARVLGINSVPILARAEAAPSGGGNCIYALDPSSSGAITVAAFASVTTSCGIVDESSSSSALICALASISASHISVVGGVGSIFCGISPSPVTGVSVPSTPDPLAYLPKPAVPACGTSTKSPYTGSASTVTITGTAVLHPNYAYCGGISIKSGANVTFEPGTYVIESKNGSAGLTVDLGATVNGNGVTFYNYGPSGGINFSSSGSSGNINLIAQTSGTYAGMLFFQDPQDTAEAEIIGSNGTNTVLEGSYYFPTATVLFGFCGSVHYNILVAYDIQFILANGTGTGNSNFSSDYSTLVNGSPLGGAAAAVVQ